MNKDIITLALKCESDMKAQMIKMVLNKDGIQLENIPITEMTEEIIKFALQNSGDYALQFIPEDKMTEEIIKMAL